MPKNTLIKLLLASVVILLSIASFKSYADWESWDRFWGNDKIQDTDESFVGRMEDNFQSLFSSCAANQCKTMAGITKCLITNKDYKKWEASGFFKKNQNGTFMQRITNVAVALATKTVEDSPTVTFEKVITIPLIVYVVSPSAYTAFQEVARRNPHCMTTFCKHNCLILQKVDPRVIENQVKDFDAQTNVVVTGVVYKSPEIPADPKNGTPKTNEIDIWTDMETDKKALVAQNYILEQSNKITSLRCLSETDGGVKLRMFCSECALNLDKSHAAMLNKTCTSFDGQVNVGRGLELAELNEEYQQELARARLEQERKVQEKALAAGDPNITDKNPYATFSDIGAGLPQFSFNPRGDNRTPYY
jgi:hypothetical protein